jgi:hypothetical protein
MQLPKYSCANELPPDLRTPRAPSRVRYAREDDLKRTRINGRLPQGHKPKAQAARRTGHGGRVIEPPKSLQNS